MLQTGIFTGYFPYSLEETASRIRELGFNTVQLDLVFKDMDLSTENINEENCKKIRDMFRSHDLPICCVSGYTNLVHPDPDRRKANLDHLKQIIRHARNLGSPYVISETGTLNPESDWVSHPDNKTEEAYELCRDVIGELVDCARENDAIFLVETYVNNIIGSIEETQRLFADIDDPHLGLLMDPTNYFETHNIGEMDQTLNRIFDSLADKIMMAHGKDVDLAGGDQGVQMAGIDADESHNLRGVGEISLPAPGMGILNYDLYFRRLARKHPNMAMIIEHLEEDDIPRAKAFIDEKMKVNGV